MGIRLVFRESYNESDWCANVERQEKLDGMAPEYPPGSPNPSNYEIVGAMEIACNCGQHRGCIIEAIYPDCTNYGGRKIMVYISPMDSVISHGRLDPHFSDDGKSISPIARLEPTERGAESAIALLGAWVGHGCSSWQHHTMMLKRAPESILLRGMFKAPKHVAPGVEKP